MPPLPHNLILTQAARTTLRPLGLRQRGRSRLWIDDHGWWLINVEFQASSWSRGSYLNVGVQWLWHRFPGLCFEYGARVAEAGFVDFESPEQFEEGANRLAALAAERVLAYREVAGDLAVLPSLRDDGDKLHTYPAYHVAVAVALSGDAKQASHYLAGAVVDEPTYDWHHNWNEQVRAVRERLHPPSLLREYLTGIVLEQRAHLKLDTSRPFELPGRV
jgi:hypothetical protein